MKPILSNANLCKEKRERDRSDCGGAAVDMVEIYARRDARAPEGAADGVNSPLAGIDMP